MNATDRKKTLQALLDGEHAPTRDRVREWLSIPGNGAVAEDLPTDEHRARVLAWATELATEGDTAMGYPVEYGGKDAVARSVAGFETLAYGDLSLLVKCGVQFGLFGGAVLHLGTTKHHERYLWKIAKLELPGCFAMTETGHGSERPGAPHDRDVRPGDAGVRRPHARRRCAQGLHRRGRPRRSPRRRLRPARRRRRVAGRPRAARPDPRRRRQRAAGRADRGLRREARPRRRRQRPDLVRRGPRAARRAARPLRERHARGHVLEPDREPDEALLHDARHADPGPRERMRCVDLRDEGRARHRDPPRPEPPPVRPARRARGGAHGLPHAPAAAAAGARDDLPAALGPGPPARAPARGLLALGERRRSPAARARDARRRPEGDRHLA